MAKHGLVIEINVHVTYTRPKKKRRVQRLKILCVKLKKQNFICYLCFSTIPVTHYSHCFWAQSIQTSVLADFFIFQFLRAHSFYLDLHMF